MGTQDKAWQARIRGALSFFGYWTFRGQDSCLIEITASRLIPRPVLIPEYPIESGIMAKEGWANGSTLYPKDRGRTLTHAFHKRHTSTTGICWYSFLYWLKKIVVASQADVQILLRCVLAEFKDLIEFFCH